MFAGAWNRLRQGLEKTQSVFRDGLRRLFRLGRKVDEEFLEELEELLLAADVGVLTTTQILESLREAWKDGRVKSPEDARGHLQEKMREALREGAEEIRFLPEGPTVVLVVGVNGTGKTTSIAKLTRYYAQRKKRVLLAASDTFRAAAIDQLSIWGERLGVDIVHHKSGADPAAVAFDALEAAMARGVDLLIVDTAGRLHTKRNLMTELTKIHRVLGKKLPGAPHEVLLVLDATTGQNAIAQAREFGTTAPLTGIILAKMDGTAKGGIVLAIRQELAIPVRFLGVGEKPDDLELFDPERFVQALFEE